MSDIRKKVSMLQVMADIKPYIIKHDRDDDEAICRECSQKRTEKLNGRLLI